MSYESTRVVIPVDEQRVREIVREDRVEQAARECCQIIDRWGVRSSEVVEFLARSSHAPSEAGAADA